MKREVTIAREGGIAMGGFAFAQIVRFGFNLLAARLLGVEALGIYALVVAIVQVAEVLSSGGLDAGLLRFVNQKEGQERRAVIASAMKQAVMTSMFVGLSIVLFSGAITELLHGGALLRLTLCSAAVALPFSVTTIMAAHAMQAHHRLMPKVVATQVIMPASFLVAMLLTRYVSGIEAALAVPFAVAPVLAFVWIVPRFGAMTGIGLPEVLRAGGNRELTSFAMPLLAISLFTMLSHWIDVMMLGFLSDVRTVGIYQPAARTAGLLRSVLLAFAGIAAPMIAGYHGRQERVGIRETYEMVTRWILTIVLVPFLLLALYPGEALSVFGKGYEEGAAALVMLGASSLLQAWFGLGSSVLAMSGGERLSLVNQAVALLLQVLLHWLLIPALGLNGAALSSLIVTMILTAVRMLQLRYLYGIPPLSARLWKPLAAGALSGSSMLAVKLMAVALPPLQLLALSALAGTVVYVLLIRAFRLEQEEMEVILKFLPFMNIQRKNEAP